MTITRPLLARCPITTSAGRYFAAGGYFAIGLLAFGGVSVIGLLPLAVSTAEADDGGEVQPSAGSPAESGHQAAKDRSKASENYYKTDEFIPGEEVVTPTGDKIKVWSSRGPVPVSPPPQPFDDPNQKIDPSQVIIDGAQAPFFRDRPNSGAGIGGQPGIDGQPGSGAGSGLGPSNMPRPRPMAPIEPIPDSIGNDSFKIENE